MTSIRAFLEQDTPRLDIEAWNPFYTEKRSRMTMAQMLAEIDDEYVRIADLTSRLTDDQLSGKAHIPLLKNTPMGEYPTLAIWIQAMVKDHIDCHVAHMRELLRGRPPHNAYFW